MRHCIWCGREMSNSLCDILSEKDYVEIGYFISLKSEKQGYFCRKCWEKKLAKQAKERRKQSFVISRLRRLI